MVVYTMLYIKSRDTSRASENGAIDIQAYIRCCNLLMQSLAQHGIAFKVLTNDKQHLDTISAGSIDTELIPTPLDVPADIKFYGAHFKIDAFKFLGTLDEQQYHLLIDSDVLCINPPPVTLQKLALTSTAAYYDVTEQMFPAVGQCKMSADKETLMQEPSSGLWAGGEFLSGTSSFFAQLYTTCMQYWPSYKSCYKSLSHQGDEMLTSCAIERLLREGVHIQDAGKLGVMFRHWSVATRHIGRPLEAAYDYFLIHLPADKPFLASQGPLCAETFPHNYLTYVHHRDKRPRGMHRWLSQVFK